MLLNLNRRWTNVVKNPFMPKGLDLHSTMEEWEWPVKSICEANWTIKSSVCSLVDKKWMEKNGFEKNNTHIEQSTLIAAQQGRWHWRCWLKCEKWNSHSRSELHRTAAAICTCKCALLFFVIFLHFNLNSLNFLIGSSFQLSFEVSFCVHGNNVQRMTFTIAECNNPFFAQSQVRHNSLPTQDIYCSVQHELHTRIAICNMYAHKVIISWENTNEACLNTFESYRRLSIAGGFHTGRSEREQSRRFFSMLVQCARPYVMFEEHTEIRSQFFHIFHFDSFRCYS